MSETFLTVRPGIKGEPVVSARELHAYVQCRYAFDSWFSENVKNLQLEKGKDYSAVECLINNKKSQDYSMSLDAAKEITMVLKTKKGKEARTYLLNCEKQLANVEAGTADPALEFIKKQLQALMLDVRGLKSDLHQTRIDLKDLSSKTYTISKRQENNVFWPEVNQ